MNVKALGALIQLALVPSAAVKPLDREMITGLMKRHFAAVTERDDAKRQTLFKETYTADVVFYEPNEKAHGQKELDAMFARLRAKFPDAVFTVPAPIDVHDGVARVSWRLGNPGQAPFGAGEDFVILSEGRIKAVYNFFDAPQ